MKFVLAKQFFFLFFLSFSISECSSVITDYERTDLQLFQTFGCESGIIEVINHTATTIGYNYLTQQLANPLSDSAELEKRQRIIKILVENSLLRANINQGLHEFAQHEPSLTSSNDDASIAQKVIQKFYFKNSYLEWLNKYPVGLEIGQVAHFFNLSAPLFEHAIIHILINEKLSDYLGMCCGHSHHNHSHKKHKHHDHHSPSKGAVFAYYAYNGIHWGIHLAGFKGLYDELKNQAEIIQEMQKQLIEVYKCLKSARNIAWHITQNSELADLIPQAKELVALFDSGNTQISADLKELLRLLQTPTFAGESSLFSRSGTTLRAYHLVANVQEELFSKLNVVAAIDFSASCAQLYLQCKDTQTPFSFTEFIVDSKPKIEVRTFWNPLFKNIVPVSQVIVAGQDNPCIGIITGPNKGGKSTALFSIAQAIVLGQTITLSPAVQCAMTPFTRIRTGFCIHQRIEQGESLFSATLKLANEILADMQTNPDGFSFIALDELFNSTDSIRGSKLADSFIRALASENRCITLISTHFLDVTSLENEMPTQIKNYRVGRDSQNNYFFEPGRASKEDVFELIEEDALNLKRN